MILPWLLAAASLVAAILWLALAFRSVKHARRALILSPDALTSSPPEASSQPVDCVVPARNEEQHIHATLAHLSTQTYPNLRLIVVDDQSTDRTGQILDDLALRDQLNGRLQVVHGKDRPDGWVGKTWAVHQGVQHSRADWLWFVDADMGLHPAHWLRRLTWPATPGPTSSPLHLKLFAKPSGNP